MFLRLLWKGHGGVALAAPLPPLRPSPVWGRSRGRAEEFLRNTHLTCTQTSEPLTRAALMCGQNKVSPSGRAPADHSVHVQVAHRAEFWGLKGHSDESPEAM